MNDYLIIIFMAMIGGSLGALIEISRTLKKILEELKMKNQSY
jgi:uncharacterized membrane protein YqgA involved in biofilm formation|tara:strand:- start:104 stop:229 length:126 start_codon:yes stop_codon:yes gene_type:complete